MAGHPGASSLLAAALLAAAAGSVAQEPPYKAEIRDLQATILDLKGLPSDASGGISDLTSQIDGLAARHEGLSVRQDKNAVTVSMLGDVLFDFDKAAIRPAAEPTLRDIASLVKSSSAGVVTIEGHTDSKGSASYNKELSLRRAKAVAQWLANQGVDPARLSTKGLGDTRPVQPNKLANGADNPQGRAQNRRVEFVLPKR
ncbi:OmpA family protein [Achromobacter denitrificans]|uniref:OmpA family protein n=1 Tax=Achromobacter denitrificans TaxID=32002 RepID=UPI000F65AE60|nr:OmpA family protein [Achromobacter denitrificans]MDX3879692.1 OmpA family protein [Achromobacter sp.]MBV2161044.1 OmpA family protein [Achromobacter denitrificans]MDF3862436.1 OmpA family protein [Achromobacter denitrificans]RSE86949.1 OmpA family protein [Achromobacter denitrificans]WFC65019.1 OmpA family protein [Achromobacter denitrificans]